MTRTDNGILQENAHNIGYLSEAYLRHKLSHAYIIEGYGNAEFADYISKALMCGNVSEYDAGNAHIIEACGKCQSCIKAQTGNHPDIIRVIHEKPTVVSVSEIRAQVVEDISIKPYYGPYKIYIIPDADLMNESAQNALLKTIEEPEPYAVIFLLSDNADGLLQTIRSRCIRISMKQESKACISERLLDEDGICVIDILEKISSLDALAVNKAAKDFESFEKKQVMDIIRYWMRDILVMKCSNDADRLFFYQKKDIIINIASNTRYEGLNKCIAAVREAQDRLDASVKAEAAYESLLLNMREWMGE